MKEGKLTPRITQTAKYMWLGYVLLTALCGFALWAAGMPVFDAACHALSTVSLGGFSTRDASIGSFDSLAIELVLMGFMVLATINFSTHFLALRERTPRVYVRDLEAFASVGLIMVSAVGISLLLIWERIYDTPWEALRLGMFNAISVASSTGFMTDDYSRWPVFAPLWMVFRLRGLLGGFNGRRHQDGARAHSHQAGRPRAASAHPPSCGHAPYHQRQYC